ncbi:hypothetical protein VTJ04DRAFT_3425 [Mycothermus thermophilus]|uniref:uncharacterized protein n=1 Tax=Humicola insolens TaxID=85995 RepID=UPI0037435BB8
MPIRDSDPEATVEPRGLDKWVLPGVRSLGPATEVTESVGAAASPTPRFAAVLPSGVMVTYRLGSNIGIILVWAATGRCQTAVNRRKDRAGPWVFRARCSAKKRNQGKFRLGLWTHLEFAQTTAKFRFETLTNLIHTTVVLTTPETAHYAAILTLRYLTCPIKQDPNKTTPRSTPTSGPLPSISLLLPASLLGHFPSFQPLQPPQPTLPIVGRCAGSRKKEDISFFSITPNPT